MAATRAPSEIKNPKARKIYADACEDLRKIDRLSDGTKAIALDIARLEDAKITASDQGELGLVIRCVEQQRKLRRELKLTPGSGMKPVTGEVGDGFESI